jgi:hypothetical protein
MATVTTHRLSVKVKAPKDAIEGEETKYSYLVKNIGSTTFDGTIQIMLSWNAYSQNVYQPLNIQNLAPNTVTSIKYSQAPLMSGYTWFTVVGALATNGNPVEVFNEAGNNRLFPFQQVGNQQLIQPLYAMRAKSNEEKFTQNALIVAAISLAVVAVFQVLDWAFRFFFHI